MPIKEMPNRRDFLNFTERQSQASPGGYWLHVNRTAMACRFEITLPMWEQAGVHMAHAALDEIDRLEQQLTIFRESSEISLINQQAASSPVAVEASLFALLVLCQKLHHATEGAFDITSGPLSRCWGFLRRQGRIPEPEEIEAAKSLVGNEKFLLDEASRTIRFEQPGVELNLGSIGKGYALDRIASSLRHRLQTALLSAGYSSILALGSGERGHRGWSVGIRHPSFPDRRLAVLRMRDCAMSTSGSEEQYFEHDGHRYSHIIDPRSGWPAGHVASVTVIASSTAVTDALATAFYVGGRELTERYCSHHPEVMVLMLETGAAQPIIFGHHQRCEVEIFNE